MHTQPNTTRQQNVQLNLDNYHEAVRYCSFWLVQLGVGAAVGRRRLSIKVIHPRVFACNVTEKVCALRKHGTLLGWYAVNS